MCWRWWTCPCRPRLDGGHGPGVLPSQHPGNEVCGREVAYGIQGRQPQGGAHLRRIQDASYKEPPPHGPSGPHGSLPIFSRTCCQQHANSDARRSAQPMDDGGHQFCREAKALCPLPELLGIRSNFGHSRFRPNHHVKVMQDEHGGTSHNKSGNNRSDVSCNFHVAQDNRTAGHGDGFPLPDNPQVELVGQALKAAPHLALGFFAIGP